MVACVQLDEYVMPSIPMRKAAESWFHRWRIQSRVRFRNTQHFGSMASLSFEVFKCQFMSLSPPLLLVHFLNNGKVMNASLGPKERIMR